MRGRRIVAAALVLGLAGVGVLEAGVYNTAEPIPGSVLSEQPFVQFQSLMVELRRLGAEKVEVPVEGEAKPRVIEGSDYYKRHRLFASLAGKAASSPLTVKQRLDLSGYLIRAKKPRDAEAVLRPALREDPKNFLVAANLATAEHLDGRTASAVLSLPDALRLWPKDWNSLDEGRREWLKTIGWDEKVYSHYRKAEELQLKLLRLRVRERLPGPKEIALLREDVDALFDDGGKPPRPVRFVGEGGKYEPGKIAASEMAKLPADAVPLVQQLLLWLPDDYRLYWLYGELLNARGDWGPALEVFREIENKLKSIRLTPDDIRVGAKLREKDYPPLFREHLKVLEAHKQKVDKEEAERAKQEQEKPAPPPPQKRPATQEEADSQPIDVRSLGVGFGVGVLAGIFGCWQLREIRRRRQARAPAGKH